MRTKRISIGLVRLHAMRLVERASGGVKVYYGGSIRADGYCLPSGEECIRIERVLWASGWKEWLVDSLADIEAMIDTGFASSAREAVEMLNGRSFGQWCDDQPDQNRPDRVDWDCIPASAVEPLTDALYDMGTNGDIVQAIYEGLILGHVPSRGDLVRATGCTDWRARKSIERLEEIAAEYAEAYRIDRLVREIVEALAD